MACPCWPSAATATWGLADRVRSRSAARKTYHAHGLRTRRAMRRERRAVEAPCGRLVFSRRQLRRTGARTVRKGGRRPPASVASGTGLPSGACEVGSGGGRARTPSVARLGAASRVRSRSSVAASRKPALRPNGFTYVRYSVLPSVLLSVLTTPLIGARIVRPTSSSEKNQKARGSNVLRY